MKKDSRQSVSREFHETHLRSKIVLLIMLLTLLNAHISSPTLLAQSSADFTLNVYPHYFEATAGQTVTYPVFCNSINNFVGGVTLNLNGIPSGVFKSYSFSLNPVMLSANATVESDLTITTNSAAQPGYYSFMVDGSSSSLNHSYQINLSLLPSVSALPSASLIPLLGILFIALTPFRQTFTKKKKNTRKVSDH